MLYLFAFTLFLGSALIFLVEPMYAKMVLPLLGGTPAVWNTCAVFFQAALLAGYGYAHAMGSLLRPRRQVALHVVVLLLPLLLLPIVLPSGWLPPRESSPIPWLLFLMLVTIGAPFVAVSTTAPLAQKWFASTDHPARSDPYFLYASSNAGSFVGLIGYIALVEPHLTITQQSALWKWGYILLVLLIASCGWAVYRSRGKTAGLPEAGPPASGLDPHVTLVRRLRWVALAFVPSSLMLGVTTFITTDIAAIPLLWVAPLSLYLLTFVMAFSRRSLIPLRALVWVLPALVVMQLLQTGKISLWLPALHLLTFFVAALVCHGELARSRPHTKHLTEFYLLMAVGGVLGGVFNALVAPVTFDSVIEYPMILALACVITLRPARLYLLNKLELAKTMWCLGLGVWAGAMALHPLPVQGYQVVHQERSFFGVLRVLEDKEGVARQLGHGTTMHGSQYTDKKFSDVATSYFYHTGPVGQIITTLISGEPGKKVGIIGLGAGTLSAYAGKDQEYTFYEIDPAVLRIASDPGYFTYLSDARERGAEVKVALGDARLTMAEAPDGYFDLIVLDAFSSDSIPTHLLTRQALQIYLKKLKPNGLMAFHISNRYLKLRPIVGDVATELGLVSRAQYDSWVSPQESSWGKAASHWVMLARDREDFGPLAIDPRWEDVYGRPDKRAWTDDFSNILDALLAKPVTPRRAN